MGDHSLKFHRGAETSQPCNQPSYVPILGNDQIPVRIENTGKHCQIFSINYCSISMIKKFNFLREKVFSFYPFFLSLKDEVRIFV